MTVHDIEIPISSKLFWTMGNQNLSIGRAIAEFVDNSIDASKGKTKVSVELLNDRIVVTDSSSGMDLEELIQALTPAESRKVKSKSVGGYGFGLKTASAFLGNCLEITTTRDDMSSALYVKLEENRNSNELELISQNTWNIKILEIPKTFMQGTIICISKLNRPRYGNDTGDVKAHFSKTFARFLKIDSLCLDVDGEVVEPYTFTPYWQEDFNFTVANMDGEACNVSGWVGVSQSLEKSTTSKTDNGFHLYLNGRLLNYAMWIGLDRHPEMRLLVGEINLENFKSNVIKTEIISDSQEYIMFEQVFYEWLKQNNIRKKINKYTKELTRRKKESSSTGGNASGGTTGGNASGGTTGGNASEGTTGGNASGGTTGGNASGGTTGGNASGGTTGGNASGGATGGNASGGTTGGNASGESAGDSKGTDHSTFNNVAKGASIKILKETEVKLSSGEPFYLLDPTIVNTNNFRDIKIIPHGDPLIKDNVLLSINKNGKYYIDYFSGELKETLVIHITKRKIYGSELEGTGFFESSNHFTGDIDLSDISILVKQLVGLDYDEKYLLFLISFRAIFEDIVKKYIQLRTTIRLSGILKDNMTNMVADLQLVLKAPKDDPLKSKKEEIHHIFKGYDALRNFLEGINVKFLHENYDRFLHSLTHNPSKIDKGLAMEIANDIILPLHTLVKLLKEKSIL